MNFKTFEGYLRELERVQTDRQAGQMHKHFSTLLEIIENEILISIHV